jgi:hypothetical protein
MSAVGRLIHFVKRAEKENAVTFGWGMLRIQAASDGRCRLDRRFAVEFVFENSRVGIGAEIANVSELTDGRRHATMATKSRQPSTKFLITRHARFPRA